ncbi:MAG: carboxymuconolactone decarboxylase family protein [Prolixibacteraceae bacterium]|nr:carboxymuconolactone decarboxylase family protein [Prolixibacteraceae bacterium]
MEKLTTDMNLQYDQFMDLMKKAGEVAPGYAKALMEFVKQAERPGALSTKTKELISIALGVTAHCTFCIAFHTKNAIAEGATKQEILEAVLVAGLMGGGPAVAHLRYLIDACDQFGAK